MDASDSEGSVPPGSAEGSGDPEPGSPERSDEPGPGPAVTGGMARTPRADAIRRHRSEGPGLLQSLPGIAYQCRHDPAWTLDFVSGACRELTGHSAAELVGEESPRWSELVHPDDRERVRARVRDGIDADRPFELEYRIRDREGRERWVWERGHPVRDAEGRLLGLEGFVTEVTERRRATARLEETVEQLRETQKREALAELTGAVAHDFNNFLTGLIGTLELVADNLEEGTDEAEQLAQARGIAERAAGLTRQLLTFSRKDLTRPETFDLNGVVERMGGLLRQLTGSTVTLEVEIAPGPLPVHMDPGHVEQVVMNLVLNARDAMPTGGTITVRTGLKEPPSEETSDEEAPTAPGAPDAGRPSGVRVLLEVADDGQGMDDETRARIFAPFFTTKESGTGLGLSTVKRIVDDVCGSIDVESAPDAGTTFRVRVPAAPAESLAGGEGGPGAPLRTRRRKGSARILVVEDDEAVRRMMETALTRHGYEVAAVRTGADALEWARADGPDRAHSDALDPDTAPRPVPDLLLADVSLPDRSGVEVATTIAAHHPDCRILMASGYAPAEWPGDVDALPPHDFLEKPFSIDDLLAAVRDALGRDDDESAVNGGP